MVSSGLPKEMSPPGGPLDGWGRCTNLSSARCFPCDSPLSLSHTRCKGSAASLISNRGCSMGFAWMVWSGYICSVVVSLEGTSRSFYPNEVKIAHPCTHDRGCILRQRRIRSVDSLCPARGVSPGTSGSKEGNPLLLTFKVFSAPRKGSPPSLNPLAPGACSRPGQREPTNVLIR